MRKNKVILIIILNILGLNIFSQDRVIDTSKSWTITDPFYPKYHLSAPYGWMNDPHPVFFKGSYHLFYQFSFVRDNPYGRVGLKQGLRPHRTWGHIISNDLIHWRHMPLALTPSKHGRPNDPHLFSGVVVANNDSGAAFYTINNIDVWLALSMDDDLRSFTKYPDNPVIKGPPLDLKINSEMRDPWVWKEGDKWYMIIGSGLEDGGGSVIPLYESSDLINWNYLHPLWQGGPNSFLYKDGDAGFSECPSFFKLGEKHVLVVSDKATYFVGNYENHHFVPEFRERLDYGKIYVPQFSIDDKNRCLMWGWIRDGRDYHAWIDVGWAGSQTLPRLLTLSEDGSIQFEPAGELTSLRKSYKTYPDAKISAKDFLLIDDFKGLQYELEVILKPGSSKIFGLELLGGESQAKIYYDQTTKTLHFNDIIAPLELIDGKLSLHIFLDAAIIEIFANKKVCITNTVQPSSQEGFNFRFFCNEGISEVNDIQLWEIGTIW